jgi:hypothetical protein
VASDTIAAPTFGVLVYADGLVHAGRQVLGADPWHGGCFRSHPGPVGEVRGGQTVSALIDVVDQVIALIDYLDTTRPRRLFAQSERPSSVRPCRVFADSVPGHLMAAVELQRQSSIKVLVLR